MFSFCSLCRPEREPAPPPTAPAAPTVVAAAVPPPPQALLRSKSEGRILGALPPSKEDFIRSQSLPSASLLEAARRRQAAAAAERAAAEAAQAAAQHAALAESFVQQYMEALRKGGEEDWATPEGVGALFTADAVLVAVDGSAHHGLAAVLRRLNSGVAQLLKMAGQQAELPAFELEGPAPGPGGDLVVMLRMRRGLQRLQLTLTFSMRQGRIARLHNARG